MKTKIHDTYIDLREVVSIGPLISPANSQDRSGRSLSALGCYLKMFGSSGGDYGGNIWMPMTDAVIDPYQLDDSKNALARATANANYQVLVDKWLATD